MAQIVGREGSMSVAGNAVAEVRDFSINITTGGIDANTMQSGDWDKSVAGRKMWTAEVNCFYDPADTNGQLVFVEGADVACEFYVEGETSGNEQRTGTARVEEISITGSGENDAFFEFSATLKGVGALTKGTVV